MDLILASTSKYRRKLLKRLGVSFHCEDPAVDEDETKADRQSPVDLAVGLAVLKASQVANRFPQAAVLGGDQLVALDDCILGKPGTSERAVEQLQRLAGRMHELVTAIAVCLPETEASLALTKVKGWRMLTPHCWVHCDRTRLSMRQLSRDEIIRYVDADSPTDCAGSYKIEARGICLFERIETVDHTAITGLPMIATVSLLREIGFSVP